MRPSLPTSGDVTAQRGTSPGRLFTVRVHREIESQSPVARAFFDEGLSLHYAYRHPAPVEAFCEAQLADPRCAMCALGEAIALGPSVGTPTTALVAVQSRAAVRRAQGLVRAGGGTITDAEWTRAVANRYASGAAAYCRRR